MPYTTVKKGTTFKIYNTTTKKFSKASFNTRASADAQAKNWTNYAHNLKKRYTKKSK